MVPLNERPPVLQKLLNRLKDTSGVPGVRDSRTFCGPLSRGAQPPERCKAALSPRVFSRVRLISCLQGQGVEIVYLAFSKLISGIASLFGGEGKISNSEG